VVIDVTMAERAFPGESPVGKRLVPSRFSGGSFVNTAATVVGVIGDVRDRSPSRASPGQVFWPFAQSPRWELTYFVRTAGDPTTLVDQIRRVVSAVDPSLSVAQIASMDDYVQIATAHTRFLALVGSVFSALALLVASVGLYGVVAFVTLQRTHEFGVRTVLGASRTELLRRVVGGGLKVAMVGVGLGMLAAVGLTRFLEGIVYGVSPHDPLTMGVVGVALLAVAIVASLGPALRATRADPLDAIRDS